MFWTASALVRKKLVFQYAQYNWRLEPDIFYISPIYRYFTDQAHSSSECAEMKSGTEAFLEECRMWLYLVVIYKWTDIRHHCGFCNKSDDSPAKTSTAVIKPMQ